VARSPASALLSAARFACSSATSEAALITQSPQTSAVLGASAARMPQEVDVTTWQSMYNDQVNITKSYRERLQAAEALTLKLLQENSILQETMRQMMENEILANALRDGPIQDEGG